MRKRQEKKGSVEDQVSRKSDPPQRAMIDTSNYDLSRGEFDEFLEATFTERRDEALWNKNDFCAGALGGTCDRVIVTDRTLPGFEDIESLKCFATNCC
jgi:hypothetical protein